MAYVANIVTVAEMQFMAGENRDATGDVEANHIVLQNDAESYLSIILNHNLDGTGFTDLDSTLRGLISEWAARYAGISLIAFNMAGYTSRIEAENMINIHVWRMDKIEKLLKMARSKTTLRV